MLSICPLPPSEKSTKVGICEKTIKVSIGKCGAELYIGDENQYAALRNKEASTQKLSQNKVRLTAIQNELPVKVDSGASDLPSLIITTASPSHNGRL